MIETVIVIVTAIPVPSQDTTVVSFYINQHSQDIQWCVPNIQEIVKTHGAIEWIKIQGIAKATWTAITNRYLSTQLGPKS